eukprot:2966167-Pyramimonas_sp.AAC.1
MMRRGRNREDEEKAEETSWWLLWSFLGSPGSFLGASWRSHGGLLGPRGGLWGLLRGGYWLSKGVPGPFDAVGS